MAGSAESRTAAAHPRVTEYLRQLDAVLRRVPSRRAAELREQITTHIEDALAPGASDEEVAEVLAGLGRPLDLANAAVATAGKRPWPARVGWQTWVFGTAVILAIAGVIGYRHVMLSAAPIEGGVDSIWLYHPDRNSSVDATADGRRQTTVLVRPGQQQGIAVELFNPSDQAQTVLGPIGSLGPACSNWHFSVSAEEPDRIGFFEPLSPAMHYAPTRTIPPHRTRVLRIEWRSARGCLVNGSGAGFDQVTLRVRVGLLTRTETVDLAMDWSLTSKPDQH
jgi:hypothetical protein